MKKSYFWLLLLFIFLTTYTPKSFFSPNSNLSIKKITIENNMVLNETEIKEEISFLYNENLFFLKLRDIEKKLEKISFIESFSIKKIYPNRLKLIIVEKKPIAILHNKKDKFFISNNGDLINFRKLDIYKDLPTVFGNGETFFLLYKDLQNIKFPIQTIKSFYFFESGRWDIIIKDDKVIKLPTIDQLYSLQSFMNSKKDYDFNQYKIFDYRIKDQLILN